MVKMLRSDAAQNRQAIVTAARELFAQEGTDAPIEALVKAAGVGRATFYRHFPNRHDLTAAAVAESVLTLRTLHATLSKAEHPADALLTWLQALVAFSSTYRGLPGHVLDASSPSTFRDTCEDLESMTAALAHRDPQRNAASLTGTDLYVLANAIAWTIELTGDAKRADAYLAALTRS